MFSSSETTWQPYTAALTFDDGPHPFYTYKLLEIFEKYNIKVTFFLVGKQIDKYPELVQAISAKGHEIGNHTYNHLNLTKLTLPDIHDELYRTHQSLRTTCNREARWFRPAGGNYNDLVIQTARSLGYSMALWDVAPLDHMHLSPDILFNKIIADTTDGAVVLLHSGIDTTLMCLPRIIENLRARGFRFMTISESEEIKNLTRYAQF